MISQDKEFMVNESFLKVVHFTFYYFQKKNYHQIIPEHYTRVYF